MTNYNNDILELLKGETPKQKYDYLTNILKLVNEHSVGVEYELLSICDKLDKRSTDLFNDSGSDSYEARCCIHDTKMLIYKLTNQYQKNKVSFEEWRREVEAHNHQ